MGLSIDRDEFDAADHARFAERLTDDLAALRALLATPEAVAGRRLGAGAPAQPR